MLVLKSLLLCAALGCALAQGPTTPPVAILKQINRQNDDGSYSYGYEAADGSFKIETKYPNGDVAGKYGYIDQEGKTREVTYGAGSQRGFEPQGTGIMVPPPTLNDPPTNALTDGQEDDGQYREDPKIYEDPKYNGRAQSRPSLRQYQRPVQQPETQYQRETFAQPIQPQYQQPAVQQSYQQPAVQQSYQQPAVQQSYQQPSQFRSSPLYTQQTSLFNQGQQASLFNQSPQQFPQQENRPVSQIYHQQPQFSYQAYTPAPYQQSYQQPYQPQSYQPTQNFNPFSGHPAQNFDPNTGSYSINFTG